MCSESDRRVSGFLSVLGFEGGSERKRIGIAELSVFGESGRRRQAESGFGGAKRARIELIGVDFRHEGEEKLSGRKVGRRQRTLEGVVERRWRKRNEIRRLIASFKRGKTFGRSPVRGEIGRG